MMDKTKVCSGESEALQLEISGSYLPYLPGYKLSPHPTPNLLSGKFELCCNCTQMKHILYRYFPEN
jgi:hypothetical protein